MATWRKGVSAEGTADLTPAPHLEIGTCCVFEEELRETAEQMSKGGAGDDTGVGVGTC